MTHKDFTLVQLFVGVVFVTVVTATIVAIVDDCRMKSFDGVQVASAATDPEYQPYPDLIMDEPQMTEAGWSDGTIPPLQPLEPTRPSKKYVALQGKLTPCSRDFLGVMPWERDKNFKMVTSLAREITVPRSPYIRVCWLGKGRVHVAFGDARIVLEPTEDVEGVFLHSSVPSAEVQVSTSQKEHKTRYRITAFR
ncbi:MAG: hypothetical protein WC451_01335 [Patescibacteria group bacterium]